VCDHSSSHTNESLTCVAACCSMLHLILLKGCGSKGGVSQCVEVCCSVLQCVAV